MTVKVTYVMQPRTRMLMEQERQRRLAAGIARSQCGISHILNECIAEHLGAADDHGKHWEVHRDRFVGLENIRPGRAIPKPGGKKR